jgi:hypothetical protein
MKHRIGSILFGLAVLVGTGAAAQTVYIPAGAHGMGYNGTVWKTDIELKTCTTEDAKVRVEALLRNTDNSNPPSVDLDIPGGTALRVEDALKTLFHMVGTAAFRVTTFTGCVLATSRTYNDADNGTFGQYVPAIPEGDAFDRLRDAQLIQLSQSDDDHTGYRTAIGLLNLTATDLRVRIMLYESTGKLFGPYSKTLGPFEYVQLDKVFRNVTFRNVSDGYAILTTESLHGKYLAYASVVDNQSGDAIFIPAQGLGTDESQ